MQNLVGQTLNRYKIVSLLGEGGMGAVFKAHDITLQRDVAIKVMHPHYARQSDFQERFLQEARTAARLDHPGIVQVHDFGHDRSLLYIVMEFIPGDNLENMLRDLRAQGNWILLPESVNIIRQAALALDYAHRQGVLHRDIKPANVMLEPEPSDGLPYRPVMTDLGLAKLAEGGMMTQEGSSMGTPAYMSPEQSMGKPTDARSDVYSLGILLFELATGRLPFPAKTITEARRYHAETPPPSPRSVRADLPENLEYIILQAIEKDPAKRFASAAALAEALKSVQPAVTEIASAPATLKGAVSLFTQYQQSMVVPRGPSILDEFAAPSDTSQDRIQILSQDKTSRSVIPSKNAMTIGRDADNEIVLDDHKASRQHARIEFDGSSYRVFDLNSTNGTFLANARLLPGVPEVWAPDKALRIGDTWLRLLRGQAVTTLAGTVGGPIPATRVDMTRVTTSAGQGRVGIFVETSQITIDPGQSTSVPIVLLNQGATVDHFKLSVTGVPAPWVTIPEKPLQLMPGDQKDAAITLHPPRESGSRAGRYPIAISVISQDQPGEFAEVKATVTVATFSQFSSEIYPQKIRAGQVGRLKVKNQGNVQETFSLNWKDRGNELAFEPPKVQINVPEGQEVIAEFRPEARQRRLIGSEKTHSFTAQVSSAGGQPQKHSGEVISRAMIPVWVPPLLIFLCLLLIGALALGFGAYNNRQNTAENNAQASETALVGSIQGTQQASTQTALALADANQATKDAATTTAVWMDGDDDKDGLTNAKEIELGTLPGTRDTDSDGLDDGEEVNNHGTDPLKPDTDNDGLKDGDEVSRAMDPLNPDSDGDGIPDAQDPAPIHTSTSTVDAASTQQAASQTAAAETAAAQLAGTQTAAALTAAAQQAAQQTAAAQTQSAQQTSHAATLTAAAAAQVKIAYVYSTNSGTANDFKSFLESNGYKVDLIVQGNVLSTNFAPYDAIIIGPETGDASNYQSNPWGDPAESQANHVNASGKPIIGIGRGGSLYFQAINLFINWGQSWVGGAATDVHAENPGQSIWNTPNSINIPPSQVIPLYSSPSSFVAVYLPGPIVDITTIGRQANDADHFIVIMEDSRYVLWGFDGGPSGMSNKGQKSFLNLLYWFAPL